MHVNLTVKTVNQNGFGALDVELFRQDKGIMHGLLLSFHFLLFIGSILIKE